MSVVPTSRFGFRSAITWGIAWGVGVGVVEYLTVASIEDWGSVRQLVFWLLYWMMPYWCLVGCIFVWLADHHERFGSRLRLLAAFLALCGLSAALDPILSIMLIRLTRAAIPQFDQYTTELKVFEPTWETLGTFFLYQVWETLFYGGLLVSARIFTLGVERVRHLMHQSAMARSRTESSLNAARLQALQSQIDPNLLLDSMQELELRYRISPERAEQLLETLVEFLRYAMHGLRVPVSAMSAELQLARAFSQLQRERGVGSGWRIIEEPPPPGTSFKFPSLLMLPLMALGGDGGRPMLRFRAESGRAILSLHGLSRSVSAELSQQVRSRLYALYGERFHFEFAPSNPNQLRITLDPNTQPGETYA
jgi:hypothetical protein